MKVFKVTSKSGLYAISIFAKSHKEAAEIAFDLFPKCRGFLTRFIKNA